MLNSKKHTSRSSLVLAFFFSMFYSLIVVEWEYFEEGSYKGMPVLAAGYFIGLIYSLSNLKIRRPMLLVVSYFYSVFVIAACVYNDLRSDLFGNIIKNTFWIIALDVSYVYGSKKGDFSWVIKTACMIVLPIMVVMNILNLENTFFKGADGGFRDAALPIIIMTPYLLFLKSDVLKTVCFIFILLLTFISSKRSALIALFFAYGSYFLNQFKNNRKQAGKIYIFLLMAVTAGAVYYISNSKYGSEAVERLFLMGEGDSSGRDEIYGPLLKEWERSDIDLYLLGHGTLATVKVVDKRAHNDFLQVAFDYGFIPFLFFCIIYIKLITYAFRINRKNIWIKNNRTIYIFNLWIFILLGLFNCYVSVPQMFAVSLSLFGYLIGMNGNLNMNRQLRFRVK